MKRINNNEGYVLIFALIVALVMEMLMASIFSISVQSYSAQRVSTQRTQLMYDEKADIEKAATSLKKTDPYQFDLAEGSYDQEKLELLMKTSLIGGKFSDLDLSNCSVDVIGSVEDGNHITVKFNVTEKKSYSNGSVSVKAEITWENCLIRINGNTYSITIKSNPSYVYSIDF